MKRLLVLAALASALVTTASAEPYEWRGPLPIRDQFPLEMIALDFTPRDGGWLERGEWAIEVGLVHVNSFEISEGHDQRVAEWLAGSYSPDYSFVADTETTRAHVRVDFGVGSRVQLGLEIPMIHHGSGFLDSIIDTTHDSFGLPGNDREDRPNDQLEFDVIAGAGRFYLDDDTTELGDVVLSAKIGLHEGYRHAVSLVLEAKAPTGDEKGLAGSGSWDYGLSIVGSALTESRRHAWHWGFGYSVLGEAKELPIDFDDKLAGFFAYEYMPNERWSVVAQAQVETSGLPDKTGSPQGDPRAGIAVGFHHGRGDWQISSGFLENVTTNDNSMDLGFFFLTSWRH